MKATSNNSLNLEFNENGCEIKFSLPKKVNPLTEEEIENIEKRNKARFLDILGSFAPRIENALVARMAACNQKLLQHIGEAWTPCPEIICWTRKDGTTDHFMAFSYRKMEEAVRYIHVGNWQKFLSDICILDQTIKALLNMPELDHSDSHGFLFSELVSGLMEHLTVPAACFLGQHE